MLPVNPSSPPKPTMYWHKVINYTNEEGQLLEVALKKLQNNETKSLDLEFLHIGKSNYPLLSFRLNHSDRGLGTVVTYENLTYFIVLQVIYNHDYHKTILTQKGGLNAFMQAHITDINKLIKEEQELTEKEQQITLATPASASNLLMPQLKKRASPFIVFSEEQQQLLTLQQNSGKVLLVTGGPGSGKTIMALGLLKNELALDHGTKQTTLLYLTQSASLAKIMRSMWQDQAHDIPENKQIYFLTYNELIQNELNATEKTLISESHFKSWIHQYLKKTVNKKSTTLDTMLLPFKNHPEVMLYKEFRILSGYSDKDYLNKATKSLFPEPEHRKWIIQAFKDYQLALEQQKLIDPALSEFPLPKYDYVFVDEAQDLSGAQLKSIQAHRLCFFYDPNQTLDDCLSKTTFLLNLHDPLDTGNCIQFKLCGSYRFPEPLIQVANKIIELKLLLIGGILDKDNQKQVQQTEEQALFHKKSSSSLQWVSQISHLRQNYNLLEKIKNSTQVAIITLDNYVDEAKKLFNTVSVFTPESIKGLEFQLIILYRLLDHPQASLANIKLANKNWDHIPQHQPKKGHEHDPRDILYINQLYTALTRSEGELIWVQEYDHKIRQLFNYLRPFFAQEEQLKADYLKDSSEKDWLNLAEQAIQNGNHEYAQEIFAQTLNKSEQEFIKWQQNHSPKKIPERQETENKAIQKQQNTSKKTTFFSQIPSENKKTTESKMASESLNRASVKTNVVSATTNKPPVPKNLGPVLLYKNKPITAPKLIALLFKYTKGKSHLEELLTTPERLGNFIQWCKNVTFLTEIKSHSEFIPLLLKRVTRDESPELENNSILLSLCHLPEGRAMLRTLLAQDKTLLSHKDFIPTLIARTNSSNPVLQNVSCLYFILSNLDTYLINYLVGIVSELVQHEDFIDTLVAKINGNPDIQNMSAFYWLIFYQIPEQGSHYLLFKNLCDHPDFLNRLFAHEEFLDTLLARVCSNILWKPRLENISPLHLLFWNEQNRFLDAISQNNFWNKIFTHKQFMSTLLYPEISIERHIVLENLSLSSDKCPNLLTLILASVQHSIFTKHFLDDAFFIELQTHQQLIPCLLTNFKNHGSALHALLRTTAGRELFEKLAQQSNFIEELKNNSAFSTTLTEQIPLAYRHTVFYRDSDQEEQCYEQGCIYLTKKDNQEFEFKAIDTENIRRQFTIKPNPNHQGRKLIEHLAKNLTCTSEYESVDTLLQKYFPSLLPEEVSSSPKP